MVLNVTALPNVLSIVVPAAIVKVPVPIADDVPPLPELLIFKVPDERVVPPL